MQNSARCAAPPPYPYHDF